MFYGPDGTPTTGLDADGTGHLSYPGFPDLPVATYQGDGFNNPGPGGKRIPIDSEGIVLNADGSFWVSDEYGYLSLFSPVGRMIGAIRPPDAFIPMRNGTESFSADSPTYYASKGAATMSTHRIIPPEEKITTALRDLLSMATISMLFYKPRPIKKEVSASRLSATPD